jgi:hypothetical protein
MAAFFLSKFSSIVFVTLFAAVLHVLSSLHSPPSLSRRSLHRASPPGLRRRRFPPSHGPSLEQKYLVSSGIYYGRISNARISLAELLGLALALNRTAVAPKLDECGSDGMDSSVDALFDASAFSRATLVSLAGFDFARLCSDSVSFVSPSTFWGGGPQGEADFRGLRMPAVRSWELTSPLVPPFAGPTTTEEAMRAFPFKEHYNVGLRDAAPRYLSDAMLPDKLASLPFSESRCLVLGKNFLSLNWARLGSEFSEIGRELLPHASVRADVFEFLERRGLRKSSDETGRGAASQFGRALNLDMYTLRTSDRAFVAIHLRMGDFLSDSSHHSFGVRCNRNPSVLVKIVTDAVEEWGAEAVVLASDDYGAPCLSQLRAVMKGDALGGGSQGGNKLANLELILLRDASRFEARSCKAALFDHEVLGASVAFIGDGKSSFSQTVHQIRTLRYGRAVASTIWV